MFLNLTLNVCSYSLVPANSGCPHPRLLTYRFPSTLKIYAAQERDAICWAKGTEQICMRCKKHMTNGRESDFFPPCDKHLFEQHKSHGFKFSNHIWGTLICGSK